MKCLETQMKKVKNEMSEHKSDESMNRREFLAQAVSVGLGGIAAAAAGIGIFKYMIPVVSYGVPKKFQMSKNDLPDLGQELVFPDQKILLKRTSKGEIAAVSLVCTHLGCTVNRVTTGFQCPCHGSQFDDSGNVVGGPAPSPLAWHSVSSLPGDQIEIDTGSSLEQGAYFMV